MSQCFNAPRLSLWWPFLGNFEISFKFLTACGRNGALAGDVEVSTRSKSMKNILIIEDDESIRKMMASVLEIEGYSISLAANGQQALDTLKGGHRPDIILLDMMMPVMNGWDFLDFVRANAETAKIPIVVVSAYAESAKSVKPNAVVPKPVQLTSLLKAIEGLAA